MAAESSQIQYQILLRMLLQLVPLIQVHHFVDGGSDQLANLHNLLLELLEIDAQ